MAETIDKAVAHVLGTAAPTEEQPNRISITPLLKRLSAPPPIRNVPAADIALAWARTFENRLSGTQLSALLTLLCVTGLDKHPAVIAECAESMRHASATVDYKTLKQVITRRNKSRGQYRGGLCDIVGTGGDHHSTFNISTTASIIASPLLTVAKHGNRAQTSLSGSADVLQAVRPRAPILEALTADRLPAAFEKSSYAFLMAPNYHPGMRYATTVRKELGLRTIFNLMGPLANPVHDLIEVRMLGVAYQELGPVFAEALMKKNISKAMVVCGAEDLDEISCAGKTNCWWVKEVPNPRYDNSPEDSSDDEEPRMLPNLETFSIEPSDFGLPAHPLSEVGGGKLPKDNAQVLMSILRNEMPHDHPILHFVLMNIAALLVVSGICDSDKNDLGEVIQERGPAGGRWKEGVRLARWCLSSGQAVEEFEKFIEFTHSV